MLKKRNFKQRKESQELKQKKNKPVKKTKLDLLDDENIDSDDEPSKELSEIEESEDQIETVDQKRIRLAKKMLNDIKIKSIQKDDFFKQEEFTGVEDYDNNLITKQLQNQLLAKKNQLFNNVADQIQDKYNEQKSTELYLKGHTKPITCHDLDYLNQTLISAAKDGSIIKWDLNTQQKDILSYGSPKDQKGHYDEILSLSINFDGKLLATAGKDRIIKLWDIRNNKIGIIISLNKNEKTHKMICFFSFLFELIGHRDTIQALKFSRNNNILMSGSCDRTFKMWDATEKAYLDTFFGHKNDINQIDTIGDEDFVSCGYDRQSIYWKIEDETQLLFNGHDLSIDCIKSYNHNNYITGSQDGSISLWTIKKKKQLFNLPNAHQGNWVTALANLYNTDILASGSSNDFINFYKIQEDEKNKIKNIFQIPSKGIINDIKIASNNQFFTAIESEEHRLGRWITQKAKNRIRIFKF